MRRDWATARNAAARTATTMPRLKSLRKRHSRNAVVSTVGRMVATVTTFAVQGIGSQRVTVEVDIRRGLPAFTIVGLPDRAVRESRERVRAALKNSGLDFPSDERITVNLAPASLRKAGPAFDLALAVGILGASRQIGVEETEGYALCGELSLNGNLREIRGALAIAIGAKEAEIRRLILPPACAREAALIADVQALPIANLTELVALFRGEYEPHRAEPAEPIASG